MFVSWSSIHFLPVIIGGIAYMMYGGIYYSLLLNKKKKENETFLTNQSEGPFKYIYSVIIAFINSFFLALLIQSIGSEQLLVNTGIGFIFGLVISMVYLKNTLFGLMSKKSFWIAVGDHLIIFTILGMIHGLFM
jgi:hypothetical protein